MLYLFDRTFDRFIKAFLYDTLNHFGNYISIISCVESAHIDINCVRFVNPFFEMLIYFNDSLSKVFEILI
jgi:hypothetical protein